MPDEINFWVATVETEKTRSTAFGQTPQQALVAFVDLWVERHCAASDADPSYPWEIKDSIAIGKATMGQGYLLSNHDEFWFKPGVRGDDPSLVATWNALAERHGVFPASLDDASARLRQAFTRLKVTVETDGADFGTHQGTLYAALRGLGSLVAEDPGSVDARALFEATDNLRTFFEAVRVIALMEYDPATGKHRREYAGKYHALSFDLKRFSKAIADMRAGSPSP